MIQKLNCKAVGILHILQKGLHNNKFSVPIM